MAPVKGAKQRSAREKLIQEARDEYGKAVDLNPPNLFYPLTNQLSLDLCLDPGAIKPVDISRIVESAESSADEWAHAAIADAEMIRFLAFGKGTPTQVAEAYVQANRAGSGATPRQIESMRDHVKAMVQLASSEEVRSRAANVCAALDKCAGHPATTASEGG